MIEHGMKANTIRRVLRDRLNKWLATIPDDTLRDLLRENTIVSGGCIASMLSGDKVNDYDIYMRTKEAALAVANHYVNVFNADSNLKIKGVAKDRQPKVKEITRTNIKGIDENRVVIWMQSAGVAGAEEEKPYEYFEHRNDDSAEDFIEGLSNAEESFNGVTGRELTGPEDPMEGVEALTEHGNVNAAGISTIPPLYRRKDFIPVFFSENAITLTNKMQIVIRFYGEPDKIHENYDFAHAMCHYDLAKNKLHMPSDALECILSKTLIYKGSLYPIASVMRIRKFIARGWRIGAGQVLKIIFQLSGVDLKDMSVLREQLTGVDQAYMHELLRQLERENPNLNQLDTIYIAKLIDRIFE